jgi:arylsulfatase
MNVLFIMSDQQRYDSFGRGRHPCADHPNLEKLYEESVSFENFYASAMACVPSRQCMLTGRQEWMSRTAGNWKFNMGEDTTWMSILRDHGYHCVSVGKTHMVHAGSFHIQVPVGRSFGGQTGWNHFNPAASPEPYDTYFDIHTARRACDALETLKDRGPFAMFVGFHAPHEPYVMPKRYLDRVDPDTVPLPDNRSANEYEEKSECFRRRVEHFRKLHGVIDEEKIRIGTAGHFGLLKMLDDCVGTLLDELDRLGMAEDTVVVFCSDHGDLLGEHGLFNKGATFYESEIHIPFVIRLPDGSHAGRSVKQFGSGIDVMPTLLDILGVETDLALPGVSLLPAIRDDAPSRENVTCTIVDGMMIRTRSRKLWYNVVSGDGEMYDLDRDPGEMENLYDKPDCADMRHELTELMLHSRLSDDRVYSLPTEREMRLHTEVSSSRDPET